MNEELVPYSFQDCILFCSQSKYGTCYLTCNKTIIIEQGSTLKKFAIPVSASEAYLLTANKLMLVIDLSRHDLSDEHFYFKILVFDICSGTTLHFKDFNECDLRGLKINHEENEIRLAINTYDFETHIIVDPDELYFYPPLPTLARSSEVIHLDFSLNTKREYSFEENLPDDLILRVGSLDDQEEVIDFNSSTRLCTSAGDLSSTYKQLREMLDYEILCKHKDDFYLKKDGCIYVFKSSSGLTNLVYETKELICGINVNNFNKSLQIQIYFRNHMRKLSVSNSIKFILDEC